MRDENLHTKECPTKNRYTKIGPETVSLTIAEYLGSDYGLKNLPPGAVVCYGKYRTLPILSSLFSSLGMGSVVSE